MTRHLCRTIVYIDVANIIANVGKIDFRRLMKYLRNRYEWQSPGELLSLKIFTPVFVNSPNSRDGFVRFLQGVGFEVIITDAFKTFTRYKDNSDIKLAVEIIEDLRDRNVRNFVLMTGDRDFLFIIEKIIHERRNIEIFGPASATCSEYRTMEGFKTIESISGIHLNEIQTYHHAAYHRSGD